MKKSIRFIIIAALLEIAGNLAFAQTNYYGVSGNMVTGDFDNDGLMDDIAAFNTAGDLPTLILWTTENGWVNENEASCQLPFDFLEAKSLNSKIVAGDFDNDGFIDDLASIYEVGYNKTSITVWINNEGIFSPNRWWHGGDFDANQVAQTLVAGDFDCDGFIDDIAAFYDYDQKRTNVFVWTSNGKEFAWPGTWWTGNDFNSTRIQGTMVAGDFDHDGFQDDIAALYDYMDDYCRIFVWTTQGKNFNWPYTWFEQKNFAAGKAKNNVIAGDFNKNGFVDNIAALYAADENSSNILVFERNKRGFENPTTWWYGTNEANNSKTRLVAADMNNNSITDQLTGLLIDGTKAKLSTWSAGDHIFTLPDNSWEGTTLAIEDCEKNGSCLPNNFEELFKLYPNPNNGKFMIDIPATDDNQVEISIFNVLGSQIMKFNANCGISTAVTLDELKAGNYTMQITCTNFTFNKKFIVE